jgi:hypothetical protein
MSIQSNDKLRLARLEAVYNQIRTEMDDVINSTYQKAVEDRDEERASELARKIRNKLLDASDKQCAFDKILPEAPTGNSFVDWIQWLRHLASMNTNEWGTYRQALRDIPQQEGFPFDIEFPIDPDTKKKLEEEASLAIEEAARLAEEEAKLKEQAERKRSLEEMLAKIKAKISNN